MTPEKQKPLAALHHLPLLLFALLLAGALLLLFQTFDKP